MNSEMVFLRRRTIGDSVFFRRGRNGYCFGILSRWRGAKGYINGVLRKAEKHRDIFA
jgi:hypothetical protein